MIKKMAMALFCLFFLIPHFISANNDGWTYLDNIADQVLLLTKQDKYQDAKKMLEHFADQFIKTYPKEDHITMNDLRVITISTDEAIKALAAVTLSHDERVRKIIQLRLALDALHSDQQPLWMAMEHSVLDSFESMKEAALQEDKEKFKLQFNIFMGELDTIYPSLVIDLEPDAISRLDSHIRFLEGYDRVNKENKIEHLHTMEKDMYKLFGKTIKDDTDPSIIWVMVTTGSIILTVLLYVGIQKYRAERIATIKYRNR